MKKQKREKKVEEENKNNDFVFDLNSLKPQEHKWVDRGAVVTFEGPQHTSFRVFKRISR